MCIRDSTEGVLNIPFIQPELKAGSEYFVNISFTLKENTSWAEAGHEVAKEQLALLYEVPAVEPVDEASIPALSVEDSEETVSYTHLVRVWIFPLEKT